MKHSASFRTATVFRSPTSIHEAVIGSIRGRLYWCPPLFESKSFDLLSNEPNKECKDAFTVPGKVPDLSLRYEDVAAKTPPKAIFVTEVGFSESYEHLKQSMARWIEDSPEVKQGFLVKISETPLYRGPKQLPHEIMEMRKLSVNEFHNKFHRAMEEKNGKLFAHGVKFGGAISAFLERWIRDPQTGRATQKGKRIVCLNPASYNTKTYVGRGEVNLLQ
jgi:hypothetical protein